jgi:hypothetical protein
MSATNSLESERLFFWEHAAGVGASRRADVLLHFTGDIPKAIGARNSALLALRARLFGPTWFLRCDCPECGCTCDFAVDCARLSTEAVAASNPPAAEHELLVEDVTVRFRLPDIDDLQAIANSLPVESVATTLLGRCVVHPEIEHLSDTARDAVSRRMEALDPAASLSFAVTCSDCRATWSAPIDIAVVLWSELQVAAERTLLEVDALARAYGWSEAQVLALSAIKRSAYLQLVEAA